MDHGEKMVYKEREDNGDMMNQPWKQDELQERLDTGEKMMDTDVDKMSCGTRWTTRKWG